MPDSWFYLRQGKTHGPIPTAALNALAAEGKLAPTDVVWAEGDTTLGVPADKVVPFAQAGVPAAVPDWLDDVGKGQPVRAGGPANLDWLDDVRRANASSAGVAAQGRSQAPTQAKSAPSASTGSSGQALLRLGSATSPGMVRTNNEDSFLVLHGSWANLDRRHETAIVVVADGMGGHQAGDRASGLVIGAMGRALAPLLTDAVARSSPDAADTVAEAIDRAFGEAHQAVVSAGSTDPNCKGMGATAVALVLRDDDVHIGLVGDCRVYHQRGNQLAQITRDQSLVARMVELGQLTPEEAVNHPRRNEVTQAVGLRTGVQPARYRLKLEPGDWLIAACDGLYAHVEDARLQEEIGGWTGSADGLARHLVELTNQLGGSDNCTVVAVQYLGLTGRE